MQYCIITIIEDPFMLVDLTDLENILSDFFGICTVIQEFI